MIILKTMARMLLAYAALCIICGLLWSWGGPQKWTANAPHWLALVSLLVPTALIRKSRIAETIVFLSCFGLVAILIAYRLPLSWAGAFWVLGLLAKPALVMVSEFERRKASSQASDATSEPVPSVASSAHQG